MIETTITKRTFGVSVKRSVNYQSVECSLGFESDSDLKTFNEECKQAVQEAHKKVNEQLQILNEPEKKKINLQPDRLDTTYINTGVTYAYYFVRFYNSTSAVYSSYSDPAAAAGYSPDTVRAVKDSALALVNEQISDLITEEFLNQEISNCEQVS